MSFNEASKYYANIQDKLDPSFAGHMDQAKLLSTLDQHFSKLDEEVERICDNKESAETQEEKENKIRRVCIEAQLYAGGLLFLETDNEEIRKLFTKKTAAYGFLSSYDSVVTTKKEAKYSHFYDTRLKKADKEGNRLKLALLSGLMSFYQLLGDKYKALLDKTYLLCICYFDLGENGSVIEDRFVKYIHRYLISYCLGRRKIIGDLDKYFSWLPRRTAERLLSEYSPTIIASNIKIREQILQLIISRSWSGNLRRLSSSTVNTAEQTARSNAEQNARIIAEQNAQSSVKFMYLDNIMFMIAGKRALGTNSNHPLYTINKDAEKAYWFVDIKANYRAKWIFDDKHKINCDLNIDRSEVLWDFDGRQYVVAFDPEDYELEYYSTGNMNTMFESNIIPGGGNFAFSFVALQNYRELNDFYELEFDNEFKLEKNPNGNYEVKKEKVNHVYRSWLYGRKIQTMNCIVGKNGTGKTSIIDFLKDDFFSIINQFEVECLRENSVKRIIDEDFLHSIGLLREFKFLIIFKLFGHHYVFTNNDEYNMQSLIPNELGVYDAAVYSKYGNLYQHTTVAYFSGKLDYYKLSFLTEKRSYYREMVSDFSEERIAKDDISNNKSEKSSPSDSLYLYSKLALATFFYKIITESWEDEEVDYKKTKARIEKIRILNKDSKESPTDNLPFKEQLENYIKHPDNNKKFAFLSSGEYSFFSFFSRIYWYFGGWKDAERLRSDELDENKAIDYRPSKSAGYARSNETIVVCIDEGDLYFHPEWERKFVDYLLKIIDKSEIDCRVQVIITTNSPFMLSDILHEDVQYLYELEEHDIKEDSLLFGQNIHTLLSNSFFLKSTIGQFSYEKIGFMFKVMVYIVSLCHDKSADEIKNALLKKVKEGFSNDINSIEEAECFVSWFISHIGEPVYSRDLERMYAHYLSKTGSNELQELLKKRDEQEDRIRKYLYKPLSRESI